MVSFHTCLIRGCSSEGEHHLDTVGATGSIPVSRTTYGMRKVSASLVGTFLSQEKPGDGYRKHRSPDAVSVTFSPA